MSQYSDFLNVIDNLKSGIKIVVTKGWCTNHGLTVTANMMKDWGKRFSKDYSMHGCSRLMVSPTQGTAKDKSVNNLRHYIKD